MRALRRALVLALLAGLLPLWPAFAQSDAAEAITQQLLSTPFPAELLTWDGGTSEPQLGDELFVSDHEGFHARIDINTGGASFSANERIGASGISYDVYDEAWQAEQAYATWKVDNQDWLTDRTELSGEPFISGAFFQADPTPPYPTAVCAATVGNVVVFASAVGGDQVMTDMLYGAVFGNCKAAVIHVQSLL